MERKITKIDPEIYKNRYYSLERVKVTATSERLMMGMYGEEKVKTVFYEVIIDIFGHSIKPSRMGSKVETTWDNFDEKYISIEEDRDNKINEIINKN